MTEEVPQKFKKTPSLAEIIGKNATCMSQWGKNLTISPDGDIALVHDDGSISMPKYLKNAKERAVIFDMPNDLYHAERAHVSSTAIKMFKRNPSEFAGTYVQRRAIEDEDTDKEWLRIGSLVHAFLLEPDKIDELFATLPAQHPTEGEWNLKKPAHREAMNACKQAIKAAGKTWFTEEEFADGLSIAEAVEKEPKAVELLTAENALREVSLFGYDEQSGVRIKCKLDYVRFFENCLTIVDIKSTRDGAAPHPFNKTISNKFYDLSAAMYRRLLNQLTGAIPRFIFIAIEKHPRGYHQCVVNEMDSQWMMLANSELSDIFQDLSVSQLTDEFHSPYVGRVNPMTCPGWRFESRKRKDD